MTATQQAIRTFEELTERMTKELHAHAYENGPDLEEVHLSYEYLVPPGARERWRAEVKKRWIAARELRGAVERKQAEAKPARTYRRYSGGSFFGSATQPKVDEPEKDKPREEPEAERDEEADYVEDDTNAANNILRKLWRLQSALEKIEPSQANIQLVGSVLWRMSELNRSQGEVVWMYWLSFKNKFHKEKAQEYWNAGFDKAPFRSVEAIYRQAQSVGWRYPIAQNLNKLEEMVERTEQALVRAGAEIYQNRDRLVRPVRVRMLAAPPAGSIKTRTTTVATLEKISEPWLKSVTTRYVDFFKWKREHREGIGVPPDVAKAMLSRFGLWKFPTVTGIITAPTLRPDGTILAKEGWDQETGLLLLGPIPPMPPIADEPTRDDARKAIGILDALLDEFPFVDRRGGRSAALSGLITPVVRGALKCVPAHSVSAPEAGTGKSYYADLASGIASGDAMPIIATGNREELEKRIDAQVLAGIANWSLDNVTMPIGGDAICQAIERPLYGARILGKTETKTVRNTWSIYINGNALKIKNDATRRILRINLDAKQEKPEYRKFKGNPYAEVLRDRGKYLWAVLTVVRAYIVADKPGRLPWIGEPFSAWSDLVRSALVWLDYEDPYITTEATRDNDPDRQSRAAMLQAILSAYGGDPEEARTASEMIEDAQRGAILPLHDGATYRDAQWSDYAKNLKDAIESYLNARVTAQHLGNKFGKDEGRITDGLKLCSTYNTKRKINLWYVEKLNAP
jgi:putative DNA primase/helicase